MKKYSFLYRLVLVTLQLSFVACSDSDGGGAEVWSESLSFAPGYLELNDTETSASLRLQWSSTTWNITVEEGDLIKSVTPMNGGDRSGSGTTEITVELEPNLTYERRAQEIVARDQYGYVQRFIFTQEGFSQWQTVQVDPSVRYQKVTGFGGMYNPYNWTPSNLVTTAELDKLYGDSGLGYNILRLMVYSDKNAWSKDVSGAQRAQKLGATIFACPWDCDSSWLEEVKVGNSTRKHLQASHYSDYASHLCDYVTYMKGRGVTVYGLSMQNEPDGSFVYWTASELASFIKQYGDKIRATGVKLMAPEPEGVNINYISTLTGDLEVMNRIDIVATHLYTGFLDEKDNGPARQNFLTNLYLSQLQSKDKAWWMTEHLFNEGSTADFPEDMLFQKWSYNLTHLAKEIHACMVNYAGAYVYWYLKRYYGLLGDNDELSPVAAGEITKNGYILGHYAAYAAQSVRIDARSSLSSLTATAYELDSNTRSVILTNYEEEALSVKVEGLGITRAAAIVTTESANQQKLATRVVDGDLCIVLPPMSIVSVKCYVY